MPIARDAVPEHPRVAHFLAGSCAGAINAIFMNPATAAKYALWSSNPTMRYRQVVARMWRDGRLAPFLKGVSATLARDMVFGGAFALLRYKLPALLGYDAASPAASDAQRNTSSGGGGGGRRSAFVTDLIAASAATMLSSPFNYVRNIKYGLPASAPPARDAEILSHLATKIMRRRSGLLPALSLVQQRLRLGWGTLRAGLGMAVGARLYAALQQLAERGDGGGGAQQQQQRQQQRRQQQQPVGSSAPPPR
ncbi:hypothetical protein JKP88DRAFT_200939 [Tribonema minus]|uniref:Mitochondrial carrier protein n=1 Tax=Tribonema minus TaxID=303371 RepID=A0A835YQR9_9STRA|nr:hypothetical protein JKP88DRAFT_200939 [Tribonema minus]